LKYITNDVPGAPTCFGKASANSHFLGCHITAHHYRRDNDKLLAQIVAEHHAQGGAAVATKRYNSDNAK
jgi:hypothetical protein